MSTPKVSIVVTTYLPESKCYLDACMKSIANLNYPKESLDVVLVGKPGYAPEYPNVKTVYPDKPQFYNSEGVNFGVSKTDPESKFVLSCNDDTILTKNSLKNLVETCGDQRVILNSISPCDNHRAYSLHFKFLSAGRVVDVLGNQYRYEQMKDFIDDMMNTESLYPQGLIHQEFLCMFATLIPRKVWDELGPLDEVFKTGPDDIDYSMRARRAGVHLAIALNSLIWHFSGVTADKTLDPSLREFNRKAFKDKWGVNPPFTVES